MANRNNSNNHKGDCNSKIPSTARSAIVIKSTAAKRRNNNMNVDGSSVLGSNGRPPIRINSRFWKQNHHRHKKKKKTKQSRYPPPEQHGILVHSPLFQQEYRNMYSVVHKNDDEFDDDDDDDDYDYEYNSYHRREAFHILVLKVGSTLLVLCAIFYAVFVLKYSFHLNYYNNYNNYIITNGDDKDYVLSLPFSITRKKEKNNNDDLIRKMIKEHEQDHDEHDAFGMASKYQFPPAPALVPYDNINDNDRFNSLINNIEAFKEEYQSRYGGYNASRAIFQRATKYITKQTHTSDATSSTHDHNSSSFAAVHSLASRIRTKLESEQQEHPFTILILGNSAPAGYGNFYKQSYSFILQDLLTQPFQYFNGDKKNLEIQNLAMDHLTQFPFVWCLDSYNNNQQHLPDVIVWDFGPSKPSSLEAFLRILLSYYEHHSQQQPLFIFRDSLSHMSSTLKQNMGNNKPSSWKLNNRNKHNNTAAVNTDQRRQQQKQQPQQQQKQHELLKIYQKDRLALIQKYLNENIIAYPVLFLDIDNAVERYLRLMKQQQQQRDADRTITTSDDLVPDGFQNYYEFGGPNHAPGKVWKINLTIQQHELIGWLLSLHIINALQLAVLDTLQQEQQEHNDDDNNSRIVLQNDRNHLNYGLRSPPPISLSSAPIPVPDSSNDIDNDMATTTLGSIPGLALFFGTNIINNNRSGRNYGGNSNLLSSLPWMIHPFHCRTTYEKKDVNQKYHDNTYAEQQQKLSGGNSIQDIVVNGTINYEETINGYDDLLLPKSSMYYANGWVYDLHDAKKDSLRLMKRWDNLGHTDIPKALYGVPASQSLFLFLPLYNHDTTKQPLVSLHATDYVQSLVICDAGHTTISSSLRKSNMARMDPTTTKATSEASCQLQNDVAFWINDGIELSMQSLHSNNPVYDGTENCVFTNQIPSTTLQKQKQSFYKHKDYEEYGLYIEVKVTNPTIAVNNGACSITHVIWQ